MQPSLVVMLQMTTRNRCRMSQNDETAHPRCALWTAEAAAVDLTGQAGDFQEGEEARLRAVAETAKGLPEV